MLPNSAAVVENWASWIYEKKGMKDEAVASDLKALRDDGETQANLNYYRLAYQRGGWKAYWQARIEQLVAHSDRPSCKSYDLGVSYLRLGNRDLAFSWLNRAAEQRCVFMMWVKVDPLLDDIRTDQRYRGLLRRMNLPE
jgi:tetratricopeptide (TPR) repeat protein